MYYLLTFCYFQYFVYSHAAGSLFPPWNQLPTVVHGIRFPHGTCPCFPHGTTSCSGIASQMGADSHNCRDDLHSTSSSTLLLDGGRNGQAFAAETYPRSRGCCPIRIGCVNPDTIILRTFPQRLLQCLHVCTWVGLPKHRDALPHRPTRG